MSDDKIIPILKKLHERGWTPLRSMSSLLGYAFPVQIYQRQLTPNAIPVIRVGGTNRVYEDDVIEALENATHKPADAQMVLSLYKRIQNNHE